METQVVFVKDLLFLELFILPIRDGNAHYNGGSGGARALFILPIRDGNENSAIIFDLC